MRVPMRENLALLHENNKGADQPAHSPSATRGGGGEEYSDIVIHT